MEHFCAAGSPFGSSAQPFASSPARSRFWLTRLPCCDPTPRAAAIAAVQNPKCAGAAWRCASPRNMPTVGGLAVAPNLTWVRRATILMPARASHTRAAPNTPAC